jgi:catechol 2,3-dioxygenase-like lactoylglutathione lyase family enzyme
MQKIGHIALMVREYDEAIDFYVNTLGFQLLEDRFMPEQNKRWVLVAPPNHTGVTTSLLLARASTVEQAKFIGNQSGERVFLFLYTDDFWRDFNLYCERGVEIVRAPKQECFGTVAVFKDLYGNLWDLIQSSESDDIQVSR